MRRLFLIPSLTLTLMGALAGCGSDNQDTPARVGQACFQSEDCVTGLRCVGRRCLPVSDSMPSDDASADVPDASDTPDASDQAPDAAVCTVGETECIGDVLRRCERTRAGVIEYVEERCQSGICAEGDCQPPIGECVDADRDGAFANCTPLDCDDRDDDRTPDKREVCDGKDNNCDGVVDEGCPSTGCCDGGCPQDQACNECVCQPFDPDVCAFQDQPCAREGFNDGFYCGALAEGEPLRCIGICNVDAPDPDSTCPGANSVCAFEAGGQGSEGICTATCTQDQGCGPGLGCLLTEVSTKEGICVPVNNSNPIGSRCDSDVTFDCAEGGLCVPFGRRQLCAQSCRPFSASASGQSDCQQGSSCLPFDDFGICVPDGNSNGDGGICSRQGTTCGEDAVVCRIEDGNSICRRECRETGSADPSPDCSPGEYCAPDFNNGRNMGVCEPI